MKANLAMTAAQVPIARKPEIGVESEVYFAPENCQLIARVRALTQTTGQYISEGGVGLPAAGRDLICRVLSPDCRGQNGIMTVTLNVVLEDDAVTTATAIFNLPTWSGAGSLNLFPIGICADFVPNGLGHGGKKIKAVTSIQAVSGMTPGNTFQIYSTPDNASFVFIECTTSKGGKYNLPSIVEIECGYNPAAYTKLGVGESNPLSIEFKTRGALEQLNRFNGSQGTIRMDIVKDGIVTAQRDFFSGYFVRTMADRGAGNDEVLATSEGPYDQFIIGYPRVIPHQITVTGITDPLSSDPIVMTRFVNDLNGFPNWTSGATWACSWENGYWKIVDELVNYSAQVLSNATTPHGLTGWVLDFGDGTPFIF